MGKSASSIALMCFLPKSQSPCSWLQASHRCQVLQSLPRKWPAEMMRQHRPVVQTGWGSYLRVHWRVCYWIKWGSREWWGRKGAKSWLLGSAADTGCSWGTAHEVMLPGQTTLKTAVRQPFPCLWNCPGFPLASFSCPFKKVFKMYKCHSYKI